MNAIVPTIDVDFSDHQVGRKNRHGGGEAPLRVTRPVLRWQGGKFAIGPRIIAFFPAHRIYVEPFGGAASVMLLKEPVYADVFNDLDADLVNLFRVLQDETKAQRLIALLRLTPFAEDEFELAYKPTRDAIERARRLIIRSFMGFGTNAHNLHRNGFRAFTRTRPPTGFRANSSRSGTTPAHDWENYPDALQAVIERFRGVTIHRRDALRVITQHDSVETLFFVDPPYLPETRARKNIYDVKHRYAHELDGGGHARLLAHLRELKGMVVLCGYASAQYDDALPEWRRVEIAAYADGARPRTEILWLNPACTAALAREHRKPVQLSFAEAER